MPRKVRNAETSRAYWLKRGRFNSQKLLERNTEYIRNYKQTHPCVDCGERRWWVLDFDHRDDATKVYNITRMRYHSLDNIAAEIEKCDVRCKNCHADRHYRDGTRQSKIKLGPRF